MFAIVALAFSFVFSAFYSFGIYDFGSGELNYIFGKMAVSLVFVIVAIIGFYRNKQRDGFSVFMLIGLSFGSVGDLLLALSVYHGNIYFALGICSFIINAVMCIIAFYKVVKFKWLEVIVGAACALAAGIVLITKAGNNSLLIPAIVYLVFIMFMFGKAISIGAYACLDTLNMLFIVLGTTLWMLSDVILGLNMFDLLKYNSTALNDAVIYTYFPGQTLLALSVFYYKRKIK